MASFARPFASAGETSMPQTFRPQMTSLIDILTLLLVFLIQSFSAEGNLITPSEDLKLPQTTAVQPPKPAFTIEITQKAIVSEGRILASTELSGAQALLIDNLYRYVLEKKKTLTDTAKNLDVIIQCDEGLPFSVVKRVMFTCSKAGCSDFSVLAIQKD